VEEIEEEEEEEEEDVDMSGCNIGAMAWMTAGARPPPEP
jgi:hypothetical protein